MSGWNLSINFERESVRTIRREQVEVRRTVSSGANGPVSLLDTLLAFSAFKDTGQTNQRPSIISRQCHWEYRISPSWTAACCIQTACSWQALPAAAKKQVPSNQASEEVLSRPSNWLSNDGPPANQGSRNWSKLMVESNILCRMPA